MTRNLKYLVLLATIKYMSNDILALAECSLELSFLTGCCFHQLFVVTEFVLNGTRCNLTFNAESLNLVEKIDPIRRHFS